MKKPTGYSSFSMLITWDSGLKSLRLEYAHAALQKRRMAAQWEYDSSMASDLFNMALLTSVAETLPQSKWPPGFLALAIDPLFAPALLTVGSSEYQHGFVKEAMELFLTLTKLPEDEEDLAEIIDKAGNFLLDHEDFKVRDEASGKLAALGESARGQLEEAAKKPASDEVRGRLSELMGTLANPILKDPQALRQDRAVGILETIGSQEARAVLESLAAGGPGRLTDQAKASLARLKGRP